MEQKAQGFVEVASYVAAIEAADAMAKAADVAISLVHKVDGPDVCVMCEGNVAACEAAVRAGEAAALARSARIAVNVIPRPDQDAGGLGECMRAMRERKAAKKAQRLARRAAAFAGPAGGEDRVVPEPAAKAAVKPAAAKGSPKKARPGK